MHEAYLREESRPPPRLHGADSDQLAHVRHWSPPDLRDTGIVTVFVRVGMDVRWDSATMSWTT